jgi:hypothetical protein
MADATPEPLNPEELRANLRAFEAEHSDPLLSLEASRTEWEQRNGVHHAGGIPWFRVPIPSRFHRCKPYTTSPWVDRCACGASRYPGSSYWGQKNERRKAAKRWRTG